MAALIDNSKGFDAYVGYKKLPWHGLGTTLQTRISVAEALKYGGLDYQVGKLPNVHRLETGMEVISTDSFFTYRKDTNGILGSHVGCIYEVVQNAEALSVIDDILKRDSDLTIDTAGVLNGGRVSFVSLKRETPMIIGSNDECNQYILLTNGFDGSMAITAMYTAVRVVCMNTLTLAITGRTPKAHKYSIRHTVSANGKMSEAMKILAKGDVANKLSQEAFNSMYGKKLSSEQLRDMVYNILLNDPEITEIQDGKVSMEDLMAKKPRVRNTAENILEYHETGLGQENIRGTAWGAYNAATGYFANVRNYKNEESRMTNLMFGTTGDYSMKAFDLALNPSHIKPVKPRFGKTMSFN